uniref:Uncharacterized protein n=1 Tax=Arundo donax TaxID=35708 RepID=A0A0A9C1N2_ARUDO
MGRWRAAVAYVRGRSIESLSARELRVGACHCGTCYC